MRKILFKGKRIDDGGWIYGSPIFQDGYVLIRFWNSEEFEFEEHLIAPESVSEYTGLTDKNGNKIFEGDIVKHFNNSDEEYDIGVIYFDTEFMGWRRTTQGRFHKIKIDTYKLNPTCIYEVIGNIHDNPELLKESK